MIKVLVKKIQQKTYIKNIDGEDIVMKPVPDDDLNVLLIQEL